MLQWSLVFLAIALTAALFGFGFIASSAASFAKILFFVFIACWPVTFVISLAKGKSHLPRP